MSELLKEIFALWKSDRPSDPGHLRATVISFVLVWIFGLAIIAWFWWRSMPAHDFWLSSWTGIMFALAFYTCWQSLYWLVRAFKPSLAPAKFSKSGLAARLIIFSIIASITVLRSSVDIWAGQPRVDKFVLWECTGTEKIDDPESCPKQFFARIEFLRPVQADLTGIISSVKPEGWLGKDVLKSEFKAKWCREHRPDNCAANPFSPENKANPPEYQAEFEKAWNLRWRAHVGSFKKPDFKEKDLRGAEMTYASLEGADLKSSRLETANLDYSNLQYSNLYKSNLSNARMFKINLDRTRLILTNFTNANLSSASLQGSVILRTSFFGANLELAKIVGDPDELMNLIKSDWEGAELQYSVLRYLDFSEAKLEKVKGLELAFGDASVILPEGIVRPGHWCNSVLSDPEFFGRYLGWLRNNDRYPKTIFEEYDAYKVIPSNTPCPEHKSPNQQKEKADKLAAQK